MREELVHSLEKVPRSGKMVGDPDIMVKAYSRSAAGRHEILTVDLRPGPVLLTTVQYLLGRVSLIEGRPWNEVYDFIFDRLRAVRQDMTIQQIGGLEAVSLLEDTVRFYIYSGYRLCQETFDRFDPKINDQHTQECLKQLLSLYTSCDCCLQNRTEFESLYLIFNLGQTEALQHYYELPKHTREHTLMKISYNLCMAFYLGNYRCVLKHLKSELFTQNPLLLCAFHRNLTLLQRNTLKIMSHGYSSKALRYPVQHLAELLWFDSLSACAKFCELCGLHVQGEDSIVFLRGSFKEPEKIQQVHISGIDSLLCQQSLGILLLGKKKSLKQSIDNCNLLQNHSDGPYRYLNDHRKSKPARGRGRAKNFQEDKNVRFLKGQDVVKSRGQKCNCVEHPDFSKIGKNIHEIKGGENYVCDSYSDSSAASAVKNHKQCSIGETDSKRSQRKQEVTSAGESWEDELFNTEEEMKGALT
ncbi:SAC3 domain-containing protein 1-like isoform X2 [Ostrea edulis]|nr:SAC3 domain-containing protein 1-like isoform X2 [Ostrea edulis]